MLSPRRRVFIVQRKEMKQNEMSAGRWARMRWRRGRFSRGNCYLKHERWFTLPSGEGVIACMHKRGSLRRWPTCLAVCKSRGHPSPRSLALLHAIGDGNPSRTRAASVRVIILQHYHTARTSMSECPFIYGTKVSINSKLIWPYIRSKKSLQIYFFAMYETLILY